MNENKGNGIFWQFKRACKLLKIKMTVLRLRSKSAQVYENNGDGFCKCAQVRGEAHEEADRDKDAGLRRKDRICGGTIYYLMRVKLEERKFDRMRDCGRWLSVSASPRHRR